MALARAKEKDRKRRGLAHLSTTTSEMRYACRNLAGGAVDAAIHYRWEDDDG
jgi:hypothetical protein